MNEREKIFDDFDSAAADLQEKGRQIRIQLQNLSGVKWQMDNRGITDDTRVSYQGYVGAIEMLVAECQEEFENLHGLQKRLEEEQNDPTCPQCGGKENVRTAVDDEGLHVCEGG